MSYLLKITTLLIVLISTCLPSQACRFTVREIGFTTLSQTNYTFVIINNAPANNSALKALQQYKNNSNIGVLYLNEQTDKNNPILQLAKKQNIPTPSLFLLSPNNRIHVISSNKQIGSNWQKIKDHFTETVLDSPIRKALRKDTETTFAHILSIDGSNSETNKKSLDFINKSSQQLKHVMPLMPKEVKYPPVVLKITKEEFQKEQVLLWSLGIDTLSSYPQAVIIYGRGRTMGNTLTYEQIKDNLIFNYLSMIGADCECGLDRKWMLGIQIPMIWNAERRQKLATELGFDVDNPSILAEMSRIMAKESVEENSLGVGYGLESIDLNDAFGVNDSKPKVDIPEYKNSGLRLKTILLSLLALAVISVVIALIIKRNAKR